MIRAALLTTTAAASALLAACGSEPGSSSSGTSSAEPRTTSASPTADPRRVRISIGGTEVSATLRDTDAARDLLTLLPTTVTMREHGSVEKTGRLPRALDVSGEPDGADPAVGDLGYYAPGNDLVLYHGDQGYHPGIVVLGRLDGDLGAIADAPDDVAVEVSADDTTAP